MLILLVMAGLIMAMTAGPVLGNPGDSSKIKKNFGTYTIAKINSASIAVTGTGVNIHNVLSAGVRGLNENIRWFCAKYGIKISIPTISKKTASYTKRADYYQRQGSQRVTLVYP